MWTISLNKRHVQSFWHLHQFARSLLRCRSRRACVLAYLHVVCICIYVYVCVCSNMYTFCICMCMCIYIRIHVCTCVYVCVWMFLCRLLWVSGKVLRRVNQCNWCACVLVCICMCVNMCVCACICAFFCSECCVHFGTGVLGTRLSACAGVTLQRYFLTTTYTSATHCNEVETGGHGMMGWGPAVSMLKDMPVWTQYARS